MRKREQENKRTREQDKQKKIVDTVENGYLKDPQDKMRTI